MADVTIKVNDDGPLRVNGAALLDAEGHAFDTKAQYSLCRCGLSDNKPFCDGSHKNGFESSPRAE